MSESLQKQQQQQKKEQGNKKKEQALAFPVHHREHPIYCPLAYIYKIQYTLPPYLNDFASSKGVIEGEPLSNILEPSGLMTREQHVSFIVCATALLSQTITLLVTYILLTL